MKYIPRALAFCLSVLSVGALFTPVASAQTRESPSHEAELWTFLGLGADLPHDFGLQLETEVRFDDNISRFSESNTSLSFKWRARRWLHVGAGYRFRYRHNGEIENRGYSDIVTRQRFGPLRLDQRLRIQLDHRPSGLGLSGRARLRARFRTGTFLRPFISAEASVRMAGFANEGRGYRKTRITAGTELHFDPVDISLFYRLDIVNEQVLELHHIVGLGLTWTLDLTGDT